MSGGTKQNGQTNPRSARSSTIKTLAWRYLPAISMLVSLSVSPSTAPLTVTWWPACSATLSCASTTYTFLSASFTNTYLAPCSLTHLVVQSPAFSFAPFAPHWLSEIQPVQEPSAAIARVPRSEEHTSELQSRLHLVCRLLLEKKTVTSCPGDSASGAPHSSTGHRLRRGGPFPGRPRRRSANRSRPETRQSTEHQETRRCPPMSYSLHTRKLA